MPLPLSICIPTYNRAQSLARNLKHLIKSPVEEFEIVVCDNASPDNTHKVVAGITDSRIRYFRNPRNFGAELNFLKCFKHARGEFVFLLSDEDFVELKTIPWLIKTIKGAEGVSQILGAIPSREGTGYYFNFGTCRIPRGMIGVAMTYFAHTYLSGIIIRRDVIDISYAKQHVGSFLMHIFLMIQAVQKGDTLCTSRIVCYFGEVDTSPAFDPLAAKKRYSPYTHPLEMLKQFKYRTQFIRTLFREGMIDRETRTVLWKIERDALAVWLNQGVSIHGVSWNGSIKIFWKHLPQVLTLRVLTWSFQFWRKILALFMKRQKWGLKVWNFLNARFGNALHHLERFNREELIQKYYQFSLSQEGMVLLPVKNILDVGCGTSKFKGATGIDVAELPGVDIVWDLNQFPWPVEEESQDVVIMQDILEHLDDTIQVMEEVHRVLKEGGRLYLRFVLWSHDYAFSDPTHKKYFSDRIVSFFTSGRGRGYYSTARFKLIRKKLFYNPSVKRFLRSERVLNFLSKYLINIVQGVEFVLTKLPARE